MLALNCGFIFYNEWDRSLPSLIKYPDVPLIFTEYYEEDCKLDLQKLDSHVDDELEIVLEPSPNPFCSALPARIPTGFAFRNFHRRQIIMSNDFICIIVRSQSLWKKCFVRKKEKTLNFENKTKSWLRIQM